MICVIPMFFSLSDITTLITPFVSRLILSSVLLYLRYRVLVSPPSNLINFFLTDLISRFKKNGPYFLAATP